MRDLIDGFTVRCNLNEEPATRFEMRSQEIVEAEHVLYLGEIHMVCNVLQDLAHQHQPTFDLSLNLNIYHS